MSQRKINGKVTRAATAKQSDQPRLVKEDLKKCNHGLVPPHYRWLIKHGENSNTSSTLNICNVFLQAFVTEFDTADGDFLAAFHNTKVKFANVWRDIGKMDFIVTYLLACGTNKVLEGNSRIARKYAALASYFEQYVEVDLLNIRAFPNWPKISELYASDDHTLVSFLKHRIPCSCLNGKYKEVKSIPKIGLCCNPDCHLPFGKTERRLTMCCSRCRAANYCSRECQVAVWEGHKIECCFYADLKAKFDAEKYEQDNQE